MLKKLPKKPSGAMLEAAEKALTNPTVSNPKVSAWDALVAYRAMWDACDGETSGE